MLRVAGGYLWLRGEGQPAVELLHVTIETRRLLHVSYQNERRCSSGRKNEPPCLAFWGGAWTLDSW